MDYILSKLLLYYKMTLYMFLKHIILIQIIMFEAQIIHFWNSNRLVDILITIYTNKVRTPRYASSSVIEFISFPRLTRCTYRMCSVSGCSESSIQCQAFFVSIGSRSVCVKIRNSLTGGACRNIEVANHWTLESNRPESYARTLIFK